MKYQKRFDWWIGFEKLDNAKTLVDTYDKVLNDNNLKDAAILITCVIKSDPQKMLSSSVIRRRFI